MDWRAHIARHGTGSIPGAPWARRTLLLVLALAAILRFWDLPHLPYTHDELSALVRLYPSLWETIRTGVMALDTHPPGVQVFEWLWTRLFSLEEADVKLPFILMSLASIALLYRFAMAWTGEGAALALAVLMATLQYSVFYGQLARPYAAGLFTTALMADQLTRWLAFGQRRMLIGSGIGAVLSAATHHFSLLLAALMAVTGLLLAPKEQRKRYLSMCGISAALYLPILPITLHQLGQGGLQGWLQPPGDGWLAAYGGYIAHWSMPMMVALLAALGLSAWLAMANGGLPKPARWMLLTWGLVPLAVGYAYSVWRAPVLQYSMLLFSFPYLALFALQGLMHLQRRAALALCAGLAWVSVHSLVNDRRHCTVTYHSKYEAMLRAGLDAVAEHGRDHVLVLFDAPGHMIDFYRRLWKLPHDALRERNILGWPQARVDSLLAAEPAAQVVLGRSNGAADENIALVQHRYPKLCARLDLAEGQVFHFGSGSAIAASSWFDRDTLAHLAPTSTIGKWSIEPSMPRDSMGWDYTGREFGIMIELGLDSLSMHPDDLFEVLAIVDGFDPDGRAAVIADVRIDGSTVFYRGGDLMPATRPDGPTLMAVAVRPVHAQGAAGPKVLRAYVHNHSGGPLRVRSMTVLRREANRAGGAVLEPVPWLGRFAPE
jgi:hypothetical protein